MIYHFLSFVCDYIILWFYFSFSDTVTFFLCKSAAPSRASSSIYTDNSEGKHHAVKSNGKWCRCYIHKYTEEIFIIPQFHCAKHNGRHSRRALAQIDDTMFSEALEIYDFLEIREVIIPQFHCAKHNGRRSRRASAQIDDTMFSAILGSFASLEVREVIIP